MMKKKIHFAILATFIAFQACDKSEFSPVVESTVGSTAAVDRATAIQNATGADWMSYIDDSESLLSLSIPGTHDSGSLYEPVGGTAKNQSLTIAQQLNAGARFLDIRCRFINNNFQIYHGTIDQQQTFDQVLTTLKNFLANNPSETVIMSIKEESTPSGNSMTFEQRFMQYSNSYPGLFDLRTTVPQLGDVRGKALLFRRFTATSNIGINVSQGWTDNATFTINSNGNTIKIQDQYKVSDNNSKWNAISALLQESKNKTTARPLYVNFTSGYQTYFFVIPDIPTVSNDINSRVSNYFSTNTEGLYGAIVMDFITNSLAQKIYQTNF